MGSDGRGRLEIVQPQEPALLFGGGRGEWDLRFSEAVALALIVQEASGDARLALGGLQLTRLDLSTSSGNLSAESDSRQPLLRQARLNTSSGDARLRLAGDCPALETLEAHSSSGELELLLGGGYASLRRMDVSVSSGDVNLSLTGRYEQAMDLRFESSSGRLVADLSGEWPAGGTGRLQANSGDLRLTLPSAIGLEVVASTSSGRVRANGLDQEGDTYSNRRLGGDGPALRLEVHTSSGDIRLDAV